MSCVPAAATFLRPSTPPECSLTSPASQRGRLPEVPGSDGVPFRLVARPYQFDGAPCAPPGPAPGIGQHTDEVLLDIGWDSDRISARREWGASG